MTIRRHRPPAPAVDTRPLAVEMRRLLLVAALLVFLAGVQLFVFTARTDRYFAWTIDPPLTAAFLGASYWASATFEVVAAGQRHWHAARITVPTVFVFTTLTLVVTLVHLDRFHLGVQFGVATQVVTWAWIVVYAVVPVIMAVVWVRQVGLPGADPPRRAPLPRWAWWLTAVQAGVLLVVGIALLVVPERAAGAWSWSLTALTGRAIGAWVTSLGVAAAHALYENDRERLRPAAGAWLAFVVLQGWALLRHLDTPDLSSPAGVGYLVVLAGALVVGVAAFGARPRASGGR